MNLGFGFGVGSLLLQAGNPDVAGLFHPGDTGLWLDASAPGFLFQDAAGSIPVTAPGQPVGMAVDRGPQGFHATQASASAKPKWDLDEAGRGHLAFDGANDWLATAAIAWASGRITAIAAAHKASDAARATVIDSTGAPRVALEAPGYSGGDLAAFLWTTASVNASPRKVVAAPLTVVMTATFDMVTRTATLSHNGEAPVTATAASGSGDFVTSALTIGRRPGMAQYLNGRIYGLFLINRFLSPAETALVEAWMRQKSGA